MKHTLLLFAVLLVVCSFSERTYAQKSQIRGKILTLNVPDTTRCVNEDRSASGLFNRYNMYSGYNKKKKIPYGCYLAIWRDDATRVVDYPDAYAVDLFAASRRYMLFILHVRKDNEKGFIASVRFKNKGNKRWIGRERVRSTFFEGHTLRTRDEAITAGTNLLLRTVDCDKRCA